MQGMGREGQGVGQGVGQGRGDACLTCVPDR